MTKPQATFLPTIKASDGNIIIYRVEHLRKFFIEEMNAKILSLPQEEKEIWFNVQREYGDLLNKLCGPDVVENIMGPCFSLEKALSESTEETVNDELLNQYKEWSNRNK